jgi:Protein of unknown function (DUF3379)
MELPEMSMNLSEFIRQLATDPDSQDPEFLRARSSAPEFVAAASESARFETRLRWAVSVPVPADWLAELRARSPVTADRQNRLRLFAMAASVLLVIAATAVTWRMNSMNFDSIEQYVAYHYNHDGEDVLARAGDQQADNIEQILSDFNVQLAPELASTVTLIKFCPTPEGMGAHLVVNTASGPVTIIFMPDMLVTDGEMLAFDGMQAQLVGLVRGSAAVIGTPAQDVAKLHALVQTSFISGSAET